MFIYTGNLDIINEVREMAELVLNQASPNIYTGLDTTTTLSLIGVIVSRLVSVNEDIDIHKGLYEVPECNAIYFSEFGFKFYRETPK